MDPLDYLAIAGSRGHADASKLGLGSADIGRMDRALYGDLMAQYPTFDPNNPGGLTGATKQEASAAGHDFRNDSGARPLKSYTPNVRG